MGKLRNIHQKKTKSARKKLPVTVIFGDSLVKGVKRWELLDKNNKVAAKHFSGATTHDMNSYIQLNISNNQEYILLHCGTNNVRQNISMNQHQECSVKKVVLKNFATFT